MLTDFSKALYPIDHKIVIVKLLDLEVPPSIAQWVVDFLTNRRQRVKYKDTYSEWVQLSGGVPLGTILGPIAFLGMINDAVCDTKTKVWKYDDDLTLGESRWYDGTSNIQPTLGDLHDWSVSNHLMLNPAKCHVMQVYFGKKEHLAIHLHIADHHLEVVEKVKLLGVTIQCGLKWDSQVDNILKRANQKFLCFVNSRLQVWTPRNYYKGYIRPLLEYAAPCGTQVLLNNRLTRLRTFRSECANTSLVGTTNPTPFLLLHWKWKPSMTGVSISAGIFLARYLLLIDSQLGLLPLFWIPSCNSGEVMLSNHAGTRLSGSNLAPSHTWPICPIHDLI